MLFDQQQPTRPSNHDAASDRHHEVVLWSSFEIPSGVCLIDPLSGGLVSADQRLSNWLASAGNSEVAKRFGEVLSEVRQKLAEMPQGTPFPVSFDVTVPGFPKSLLAQTKVTPLHGEQTELLLVEISHSAPAATEQWPPDAVTGLADRRTLAAHRAEWARHPEAAPHAVLFLDLDGFKQINDQYGHVVGDRVLAELASRWRKCVREGDLVARYGGDEFVVLLGHVHGGREAAPVVERLEAVTRQPVQVGDLHVTVSVTIGIALAEDCSGELDHLIASADREMYAAKAKKRV